MLSEGTQLWAKFWGIHSMVTRANTVLLYHSPMLFRQYILNVLTPKKKELCEGMELLPSSLCWWFHNIHLSDLHNAHLNFPMLFVNKISIKLGETEQHTRKVNRSTSSSTLRLFYTPWGSCHTTHQNPQWFFLNYFEFRLLPYATRTSNNWTHPTTCTCSSARCCSFTNRSRYKLSEACLFSLPKLLPQPAGQEHLVRRTGTIQTHLHSPTLSPPSPAPCFRDFESSWKLVSTPNMKHSVYHHVRCVERVFLMCHRSTLEKVLPLLRPCNYGKVFMIPR